MTPQVMGRRYFRTCAKRKQKGKPMTWIVTMREPVTNSEGTLRVEAETKEEALSIASQRDPDSDPVSAVRSDAHTLEPKVRVEESGQQREQKVRARKTPARPRLSSTGPDVILAMASIFVAILGLTGAGTIALGVLMILGGSGAGAIGVTLFGTVGLAAIVAGSLQLAMAFLIFVVVYLGHRTAISASMCAMYTHRMAFAGPAVR